MSLLIFSSLLVSCAGAAAQSVTVDFPLESHYRQGRYMPVHLVVAAGANAASVTLQADGAVATELALSGGKADAVVPWLAVRSISGGNWSISSGQSVIAAGPIAADLRPLADDERLVAYSDGDLHEALLATATIMPGRRVVPVRLDLTRPLLAPPAAYEAIDLLLLGPSAGSRVSASALAVLAAGGTAVAVRTNEKPSGEWPWRKVAVPGGQGNGFVAWWVLDHPPVGPRSLIDMEAYAPTYGWEHGWPAAVRRRTVLLAALAGMALLGLSLWRSRYAPWAGATLSLAAALAVILWARRQSPLLSAGGALVEWDGSVSQRDFWAYRSTLRDTDISIPWNVGPSRGPAENGAVLTKPVFYSAPQMRQTGVKLMCRPDGRPERFVAHLATDTALAMLSRSLGPRKPNFRPVDRVTPVTPDTAGPPGVDDAALTSPIYVLADQLYPGRITGKVLDETGLTSSPEAGARPPEPASGEWQTIFVDNEPAQ